MYLGPINLPESVSTISKIAPWLEPILAAVIGLILLSPPFNQPNLAVVVWIVGLLFSVSNLTITERLKNEFATANELKEMMGLYQASSSPEFKELLQAYERVEQPEFKMLRNEFLQECTERLRKLSMEKTIHVGSGEYFVWLMDMLQMTTKDEMIRAVSVIPEDAWVNVTPQSKYLDGCIQTAKRGVRIERIFVTSKDKLQAEKNKEVFRRHKGNLIAYVAFREDLAKGDSDLVKDLGMGFVMFGKRVLMIDAWLPPQEGNGTVTLDPVQIRQYEHVFDRLKLQSKESRFAMQIGPK